jgi:hypothetical protein
MTLPMASLRQRLRSAAAGRRWRFPAGAPCSEARR